MRQHTTKIGIMFVTIISPEVISVWTIASTAQVAQAWGTDQQTPPPLPWFLLPAAGTSLPGPERGWTPSAWPWDPGFSALPKSAQYLQEKDCNFIHVKSCSVFLIIMVWWMAPNTTTPISLLMHVANSHGFIVAVQNKTPLILPKTWRWTDSNC